MAHIESPYVIVAGRGVPTSAEGDASLTVVLRGEYDLASVPALTELLARAIAVDDADLVVDLAQVQFMDASILGVLVRADDFLGRRSRSLWLRAPSRMARRLLEICGLTGLLDPLAVDVTSVAGTAESLSTWVAVPASDRVDPAVDQSRPNADLPETAARRRSLAAATTVSSADMLNACITTEAGRRGS